MLRRLRHIGLAGALAALALVVLPAVADAHNVGHFTLPDGQCLAIGSNREAPLVGQDRTQLDLMPSTPLPRDEYGASFAAFAGNTPIRPGPDQYAGAFRRQQTFQLVTPSKLVLPRMSW